MALPGHRLLALAQFVLCEPSSCASVVLRVKKTLVLEPSWDAMNSASHAMVLFISPCHHQKLP